MEGPREGVAEGEAGEGVALCNYTITGGILLHIVHLSGSARAFVQRVAAIPRLFMELDF